MSTIGWKSLKTTDFTVKTQWGQYNSHICNCHIFISATTKMWCLTSVSPVYSRDAPETHTDVSLLHPAHCCYSAPDVSDGRGWTSALMLDMHSWSLTNRRDWNWRNLKIWCELKRTNCLLPQPNSLYVISVVIWLIYYLSWYSTHSQLSLTILSHRNMTDSDLSVSRLQSGLCRNPHSIFTPESCRFML